MTMTSAQLVHLKVTVHHREHLRDEDTRGAVVQGQTAVAEEELRGLVGGRVVAFAIVGQGPEKIRTRWGVRICLRSCICRRAAVL